MSVPVIAIDGPSASGKGAVAQRVAQALGFHCLESGALYRLVALAGPQDPEKDALDMAVAFRDGRIFLSGQDVTDRLRAEEVGARASDIAQRPGLRQALLHRQRAFRQPPGLVAEGRDMGSVVFPGCSAQSVPDCDPGGARPTQV
jgi:cytidylate kinase